MPVQKILYNTRSTRMSSSFGKSPHPNLDSWSKMCDFCSQLRNCTLIAIMLFLLCPSGNDDRVYPIIGVRLSYATTREVDVSSLITECTNIWPRFPPPNRFACYRTRTKQLGPFQTCEANLVRETDITQINGNDNYTQFYIQTPGRLRGRTYVNRLICRWNIQCSSDQLLYMDIVEHNIEVKQPSSLFRQREVCVDYLKKFRDFGMETTCGYRSPYTDLEPREIRMEFRSNKKLRFPGFRMRLVCFNPNLQDLKGCSPTADLEFQQLGRRKRDLKDDDVLVTNGDQDKPHPSTNKETREITFQKVFLKNFEEVAPVFEFQRGRRIKRHAVRQIIIDRSSTVQFEDKKLSILENGTAIKYSFEGIYTLHTFNSFEGLQSHLSENEDKQMFRGNGVLTIVQDEAYYLMYGVDPRFQPSSSEANMIRLLMEAEEQLLFVVSEDFVIEEEEDDDDSPSPTAPQQDTQTTTGPVDDNRGKRQASVTLDPEIIDVAKTGVNSCNAVLRAVAASILSLSES